jgi:hypothetical protein
MPPSRRLGPLRLTSRSLHQTLQRFGYDEIQVLVTRADAGATTKLISNGGESSKNYASWDDALKEADHLKLINTVEATAAKALPPGFPLHTTTEMDAGNFANDGFSPGKTPLLNNNDCHSRPKGGVCRVGDRLGFQLSLSFRRNLHTSVPLCAGSF